MNHTAKKKKKHKKTQYLEHVDLNKFLGDQNTVHTTETAVTLLFYVMGCISEFWLLATKTNMAMKVSYVSKEREILADNFF